MSRPGLAALAVALLVLGSVAAGPAGAAGAAGADVEGGEPLETSGWAAVAQFLLGTALLMASVEVLVRALVRTAMRFRVSAFLLAVVFSGVEFDNVAFGVFTGFREMQDVAFGLALGNAISIFGLTLALGALAFPFEVEVPREYLAMTVAAPFVLLPFLLAGGFAPVHGLPLVGLFVVAFAYVARRERAAGRTFVRSTEVQDAVATADGAQASRWPLAGLARRDWFWPTVLVVALGGVVLGAESSAAGVEGMLASRELGGTVLGLTAVTLLYTVDDILLILEPLRLGYHDVAVGGVVGSLLFFVTGNVGVVALVGEIRVAPSTLWFHFPALVGMTALAGYFLWRGRMDRTRGLVLLGTYAAYLLATVWLFAAVPLGE